jgi:hypothetical protein
MKRIEVFYYCYIPPDMRACSWTWFIDQQIGAIKKSGLAFASKVNFIACMPMHWHSASDDRMFFKNNPANGEFSISFAEKLKEYLAFRYPFVNVLEIRDVSLPNLYEGAALAHVWQACKERDIYVFYFHSKGATKSEPSISNWREVLNHYMVERWREHVIALESGFEVSALADQMTYKDIVSGNFFWADSEYIKKLPDPLDGKSYAKKWVVDETIHERYAYEKWVRICEPKINWIHNTLLDHYASYYFLEYDNQCLKK